MFGPTEIISNTVLAGIMGCAIIGAGAVHHSSSRRMEERFNNLEKHMNKLDSKIDQLETNLSSMKEEFSEDLSDINDRLGYVLYGVNRLRMRP